MEWTLYNWWDEDARRILRNIEKVDVCGEKSRLIILEVIQHTMRSTRLSRYCNLNMMVAANVVEKTRIALADST